MDALILNRKFETLCICDAFESFIWTERYRDVGEFELYLPVDQKIMPYAVEQNYIWRKGTNRLMIIEDVLIETDAETGPHLTLTGRSLESLLERRVIAYRMIVTGSLQNGIRRILNANAIYPDDDERRIPGLRFIENEDPRIVKLGCDLNLLGESVLDVIKDLCETYDLGFKIEFNEEDETFDFSLYYGEDRSYDQEDNPWVVFSPNYENLLTSQYYQSSRDLRTAAVIAGDANYERGQEVVDADGRPDLVGLDRREMFVDGSDIELPNPTINEESIRERLERRGKTEAEIQAALDKAMDEAIAQTTAVYRNQLREKGLGELAKTYVTESFSGEIEAVRQYIYDKDFFLGDVVQVRDSYGREASSRISEVAMTHDISGESLIPTFTTLLGGANVHPE